MSVGHVCHQMSVQQMSVDQMSVDQMSVGQMIFDQKTRILQNLDHYTRHVGLHMPTNYSFFIIGSFFANMQGLYAKSI